MTKKRIRTTKAGTIFRELHYLLFYALGLARLPFELIAGLKRQDTRFYFWMRSVAKLREYEPLMREAKQIEKEAKALYEKVVVKALQEGKPVTWNKEEGIKVHEE